MNIMVFLVTSTTWYRIYSNRDKYAEQQIFYEFYYLDDWSALFRKIYNC